MQRMRTQQALDRGEKRLSGKQACGHSLERGLRAAVSSMAGRGGVERCCGAGVKEGSSGPE